MQKISITIPYEQDALSAAADMFRTLAGDAPEPEQEVCTPEQEVCTPEPADSTPELDSAGIPHDPRIHTKEPTKLVKTGRWKRSRGINKEYADSIESQLMQGGGTPPTASADDTISTFPQLMQLISRLGLSSEIINAVVVSCGAESLPGLGSRQDLIPAVAEALQKYEP